jgi:hypothetical protein
MPNVLQSGEKSVVVRVIVATLAAKSMENDHRRLDKYPIESMYDLWNLSALNSADSLMNDIPNAYLGHV